MFTFVSISKIITRFIQSYSFTISSNGLFASSIKSCKLKSDSDEDISTSDFT